MRIGHEGLGDQTQVVRLGGRLVILEGDIPTVECRQEKEGGGGLGILSFLRPSTLPESLYSLTRGLGLAPAEPGSAQGSF